MIQSRANPQSSLRQDAHIVATGLRCAVGLSSESAAAAIRAGISQVSEHSYLTDTVGDKVLCACEPSIDPLTVGSDRLAQLVELGLLEISGKLIEVNALPKDLTVLLALPETRPGFDPDDAVQVTRSLASRSIPGAASIQVEHVGEGHAGAVSAVRKAIDLIATGKQELVIAGGVDSYLETSTVNWLDAELRLARPGVRSGFPPGEGVALIALAGSAICNRLKLQSLAHIRGVACAQEHRDPKSDTGLLGEALAEAVLEATRNLGLPQELITDTYGDINGELARSHDWGFALIRTAACFRDGTDYVSFAGQCGDVGAATAALGCVLATEAWRFDCASGPRALVWAGSWGGLRGAVVLEQGTV